MKVIYKQTSMRSVFLFVKANKFIYEASLAKRMKFMVKLFYNNKSDQLASMNEEI